jgi:Flp pilus assembly protein TadB
MMVLIIVSLFTSAVVAFSLWQRQRAQRLSAERLAHLVAASGYGEEREGFPRHVRVFPPRYRAVPPGVAVAAGAALWLLAGLPLEVSAAAGILLGVLAFIVEDFVADRRIATIELQLAEAIDLLVGALRAGASLLAAFEASLEEIGPPLGPYFQDIAGRIRLGDDPRAAVGDLPRRVPLETFRLFATSLTIHWEVGGSLATTLSTVGQTVRDRIELARRVRAQGVEAHVSVGIVLVIAYVLGFLMWRADPDRLESFLRTGVGTELVAGVIGLQAFGLIWMLRLSRAEF